MEILNRSISFEKIVTSVMIESGKNPREVLPIHVHCSLMSGERVMFFRGWNWQSSNF